MGTHNAFRIYEYFKRYREADEASCIQIYPQLKKKINRFTEKEMIPHVSVLSIVAGEVGDEVRFWRKGCCWAWESGLGLMCLKHNS